MEEKSFNLILLRHAQSFQNVPDPYPPGFHEDDAPLTPFGLLQAQRLSDRFEKGDIQHIFASTLIRAAQTVEPTAQKLGLPVILLPDLMEEETPIAGTELYHLKELAPSAIPCLEEPSPAGGSLLLGNESVIDLTARGERCIKYFRSVAEDGDTVLAATHACFFGYILRAALGISLPESFCWRVNNCAMFRISYRAGQLPLLEAANDIYHIADLI